MAKSFVLKKENYTAVADFMLSNLDKDLDTFTATFATIDREFLEGFEKANETLKKSNIMVGAKFEQKKITQEIYTKADEFKDKLILLKLYVKRAKIKIPLLQETINALKNRNIEKVVKNTRDMLPIIEKNKGDIRDMPANFLETVPNLIVWFEKNNTAQNVMISKRKQETFSEKKLCDELYKYISELAEAGKLIYKNSPKKDDYTISKIIAKLDATGVKKSLITEEMEKQE